MKKAGFTLVELSIVLVIVGLLIGGILVGQSLIDAAKFQAVIKQYSQWDAAIASFKTKYKQLPGDYSALPGGGDNNGIISEWPQTWYQLSIGVNLKTLMA